MEWRRKYALRSYVRSSMWIVPVVAYLAAMLLIRLLGPVDAWLDWSWAWVVSPATARTVLESFVGAVLSFIVFAFSSLLVAIQVASAQMTPRIIATTLLRDNTIRGIVAVFLLTAVFGLGVVARTDDRVPYLLLTIALVLCAVSITAFLYFIDYAARLLRPISIIWQVGEQGLLVIREVYPAVVERPHTPSQALPSLGPPAREVQHLGSSAVVVAANFERLRAAAERSGGIVECTFRVGDFIGPNEPLFRLYGGATSVDDGLLRSVVAMGRERTIEQDATFAFRIIVDIAIKALSPAINDPTTGVIALDQLHRLLRVVGQRHLHDDILRDAGGMVRVVLRTPNWEDFVTLACREIRLYGAANFQVARRLRAMLEDLLHTLPEARHPALEEELQLLDRTLERLKMLPQDLALARTSDLQGLGASARAPAYVPPAG
jgi:uncharacterized membrane protein